MSEQFGYYDFFCGHRYLHFPSPRIFLQDTGKSTKNINGLRATKSHMTILRDFLLGNNLGTCFWGAFSTLIQEPRTHSLSNAIIDDHCSFDSRLPRIQRNLSQS
jgi:hypothetical protein